MKSKETSFTESGFFVLRTPLLPLDELLNWSSGLDSIGDDERLEEDRQLLRLRLSEILERKEIKESLFIAAPEMYDLLKFWYEDANSSHGKRLEYALIRYFSRMSSRPTPFGLFAGCTTGQVGNKTNLQISDLSKIVRHTRLDFEYLYLLVENLKEDKHLQNEMIYKPNTSLYNSFGKLRYIKEKYLKNKTRSYHLVAVEKTRYLSQIIKSANDGATVERLANKLVSKRISYSQAFDYILNLIDEQILVPDLELPVTGAEPIIQLIGNLKNYQVFTLIAKTLSEVFRDMKVLDGFGIGNSPVKYLSISKKLEKLPAPVEISRLFQVDMIKPSNKILLSNQVINEIKTVVELLRPVAENPLPEELEKFVNKFILRYESQRIPLVEALDEESGIGFDSGSEPNPLIDELLLENKNYNRISVSEPQQTFLLNKLIEIWKTGQNELVLKKEDFENLKSEKILDLPNAFTVNVTLAAKNNDDIEKGIFNLLWRGISGPSGAQLFGRFCHLDNVLCEKVKAHLKIEESHEPGAVWAEIVHLPVGRTGNVISRPILREYEITYLGSSGASKKNQIPINDLLVSVRNRKIELFSQKLGCRVIPRLTNAHNYWKHGLGIYRFLCLLQNQDTTNSLIWHWGALSNVSFLPRLRVGKTILSLARWKITKEEIQNLSNKKNKELFDEVQKWRESKRLPRMISLVDGDNILLIDLNNILSIESFVYFVRNRNSITLREHFPDYDQLCVKNSEGYFTNEILVPFVKKNNSSRTKYDKKTTQVRKSVGTFIPGSEWLYAKLYTGKAGVDSLLINVIPQIITQLKTQKAIEKWFFIRYGDPYWHLRLRISASPERLEREVYPLLNKMFNPWLKKGIIWRVQYDTYEREIARYCGVQGIELSEKIFQVDSESVLEIIKLLEPGNQGLDERWRLTYLGMDMLLNDFGLSLTEKFDLINQVRNNFAEEFSINKTIRHFLGEKYRNERQSLNDLLQSPQEHILFPGIEILQNRSRTIQPLIKKLKLVSKTGNITPQQLEEIIPNYLHMFANRLLRYSQRQQELVIYDLLMRHYISILAQEKK